MTPMIASMVYRRWILVQARSRAPGRCRQEPRGPAPRREENALITTSIQRNGTVLISITGTLDECVGPALQRALDDVTVDERDLMVDLHQAQSTDADGLLHLLALHRRAAPPWPARPGH
ncbi:hypothetical protein [Streptomyces sp. NPDC054787]